VHGGDITSFGCGTSACDNVPVARAIIRFHEIIICNRMTGDSQ
jgi:hypothetical protein